MPATDYSCVTGYILIILTAAVDPADVPCCAVRQSHPHWQSENFPLAQAVGWMSQVCMRIDGKVHILTITLNCDFSFPYTSLPIRN